MIGRRRFKAVIRTQIDLFERDHADLLAECDAAEAAYDAAPREEAEERYGAYQDLLETAADALADMRDAYAQPLDDGAAEEYIAAFDRTVVRRYPRLGPQVL
jgi:hypothetical protein